MNSLDQRILEIGTDLLGIFGLAFGTLLTVVLVPTFYVTLYRIPSPERTG